jgi:hypothetical protein
MRTMPEDRHKAFPVSDDKKEKAPALGAWSVRSSAEHVDQEINGLAVFYRSGLK